MDEMMELKKIFVLGVILLFIGIAVAPSINFNIVKASQEDDFVEVTTQACGIEPWGMKRGAVKIHFYEDLDDDNIFDTNEPSPPILKVQLKTQNPVVNRIKLIGFRGNAIFRFLPCPDTYYLNAYFQHDYGGMGIMTEIWYYTGKVYLSEDVMGTLINLPIEHYVGPI
jgi:hypothetical protein